MSVKSQYAGILESLKAYEDLLENISEDRFQETPPAGGWSFSEVFSHIFESNLLSLIALERCLIGTGVLEARPAPVAVRLILFFGMLPPGRHKAPEKVSKLVKKISREDARNLLIKFKLRLADFEPKVNKGDEYQKVKHPRLGLLNAPQWFRFIQIHTRHHTKQLQRIAKQF